MNSLTLINWFVLMQLENYADLRLILHRKQKSLHNVFVVENEVVGLPMESQILWVKVNSVLASRYCQVNIIEGKNWLACEWSDLRFFYYLFIQALSIADLFRFLFLFIWFLGLLLLVALTIIIILHFVVFLGNVDEKPNLTQTVFLILNFGARFEGDVILADGGIVDWLELDIEDGLRMVVDGAELKSSVGEIDLPPCLSSVRCHSRPFKLYN